MASLANGMGRNYIINSILIIMIGGPFQLILQAAMDLNFKSIAKIKSNL